MDKISEIILATTNRGKLAELKKMLGDYPVTIGGLEDFGAMDPIEETGSTFVENARQKALHYSTLLNRCVLADDSGLQVDALDLAPGVYSARFAGVEGNNRDLANNRKLLECLTEIPDQKRTARFCCSLCLCNNGKVLLEVSGFLEGKITTSPKGTNGFGYDPIFYVAEKGRTVAELTDREKNDISHRGQALRKLVKELKNFWE